MRIISDITGKEYKTVDECLAAEKEFLRAAEAEKLKKEQLKAEKEARKAEIQKAYEAYVVLRNAYINDYKEPVRVQVKDSNFDDIFSIFNI